MADRKHTPDILGSLLGGSDQEPAKKPASQPTIKPVDQNTGIPEYHNAIKTEGHNDGIPEGQPTIKPAKKKRETAAQQAPAKEPEEAPGDKVKATFYISGQVVEDLEAGWIKLRKLAPKETRSQVSKSLIVELAVQMALEELESKGSRSLLAKKIRKE